MSEIRCIRCGRTLEEIAKQEGHWSFSSEDLPNFVCESCKSIQNQKDWYNSMRRMTGADEKDKQIAELKKQLEEKEKTIQGLVEAQKYLEQSASYQMFLDAQNQIENYRKATKELRKEYDKRVQESKKSFIIAEGLGVRIEKLEQQLKSQPKEIIEKIKERVLKIDKTEIKTLDNGYSTLYCDRPTVITILDAILKEYDN